MTLHLKEDAAEYADDKKLGALIKQYSEFIAFPIKLWAKRWVVLNLVLPPLKLVSCDATRSWARPLSSTPRSLRSSSSCGPSGGRSLDSAPSARETDIRATV